MFEKTKINDKGAVVGPFLKKLVIFNKAKVFYFFVLGLLTKALESPSWIMVFGIVTVFKRTFCYQKASTHTLCKSDTCETRLGEFVT